ncbi:uncharacterized protein BO96DRAFT_327881, partial [Aspergillus niger CBS 101883]|uniref:uncharacterized protein n=1 Tax=Aspergillus lacticoffeatus (strain CBS 101883) TaxID=1450533 RepID=UPI000D7FBE4C
LGSCVGRGEDLRTFRRSRWLIRDCHSSAANRYVVAGSAVVSIPLRPSSVTRDV